MFIPKLGEGQQLKSMSLPKLELELKNLAYKLNLLKTKFIKEIHLFCITGFNYSEKGFHFYGTLKISKDSSNLLDSGTI